MTKGCTKVEIIQGSSSQIPAGCGSAVVSSTVVVHLQVQVCHIPSYFNYSFSDQFQGLVNLEAEVAKCDKKIGLARLNLEKLYKVISQPNYQTTLPEAVQLSNEEKVGLSFCLWICLKLIEKCLYSGRRWRWSLLRSMYQERCFPSYSRQRAGSCVT